MKDKVKPTCVVARTYCHTEQRDGMIIWPNVHSLQTIQ